MAAHHASRVREKPPGDEEATSTLKLGEFHNDPSLTLSEARMVINAVINHRKPDAAVRTKEVYTKTIDYLDIFARFKAKENIEAVERLLSLKSELETFERSQLGMRLSLTYRRKAAPVLIH
ncbi:MAG: hypothetical protein Q9191_003645 [Dirinaria sp. TL-2023a]